MTLHIKTCQTHIQFKASKNLLCETVEIHYLQSTGEPNTITRIHILDYISLFFQHYEHVALPIWLLNCDAPEELGIAQYCVAGLMYVAQDLWVQKGLCKLL